MIKAASNKPIKRKSELKEHWSIFRKDFSKMMDTAREVETSIPDYKDELIRRMDGCHAYINTLVNQEIKDGGQ